MTLDKFAFTKNAKNYNKNLDMLTADITIKNTAIEFFFVGKTVDLVFIIYLDA